jgi:hypothetical protein
MSIDRRQLIGWFAGSAATALSGCGGGDYYPPPTRFVRLLNLNQEFPSVDVSFGATTVSTALPCPSLTPRFQVEYGVYTVSLRDRFSGIVENFDGVRIDSQSPSIFVFYRHFASTRLGSLTPEIINYFDSIVPLDVDLFDGGNTVQVETLQFEGSALQVSRSVNCRLQLYATGSPVLVYDSGLQQRTDSIVVYPRFPAGGEVAVVGLNFDGGSAAMVSWPNLLG